MLAWECVGHELNTKPRVGHCSVVDILVILQYQTFLKEHAVLYFFGSCPVSQFDKLQTNQLPVAVYVFNLAYVPLHQQHQTN